MAIAACNATPCRQQKRETTSCEHRASADKTNHLELDNDCSADELVFNLKVYAESSDDGHNFILRGVLQEQILQHRSDDLACRTLPIGNSNGRIHAQHAPDALQLIEGEGGADDVVGINRA